jgi:trk system potassium uptake protein
MKVVIAGGTDQADFLIGSLLKKNNTLIVINEDTKYCEYLSEVHNIQVVNGNPCKHYVLKDANIHNADLIIALRVDDADNFGICQSAKLIFGIKNTVCIVSKPKNVEVFKKLGINTVISSAYMVANIIERASTVENLIRTFSIADERVVISEIHVNEDFLIVNKKLMDIKMPKNAIISCILRGDNMIIPNGNTQIIAKDRLLVTSSLESQQNVIKTISGVPKK